MAAVSGPGASLSVIDALAQTPACCAWGHHPKLDGGGVLIKLSLEPVLTGCVCLQMEGHSIPLVLSNTHQHMLSYTLAPGTFDQTFEAHRWE